MSNKPTPKNRCLRGLGVVVARLGIPGANAPGYELAPRTGLRKARQRKLDEHKLDARPTFHQPTIALPDELADQFPGCGGIWRTGLAVIKIHLLWDFLTGSILPLRITPGRTSDATNPIAQKVAPAGSLSLFDLGDFCLDRFQNLTRAGAF